MSDEIPPVRPEKGNAAMRATTSFRCFSDSCSIFSHNKYLYGPSPNVLSDSIGILLHNRWIAVICEAVNYLLHDANQQEAEVGGSPSHLYHTESRVACALLEYALNE